MKCVIVTNGQIDDYQWLKKQVESADILLCADGAAKHLMSIDVYPDCILGDFDSIDQESMEWIRKKKISEEHFPPKKDVTDTDIAIDYALSYQPEEIIILGALGTRMDHTLGNLYLLEKYRNSVESLIIMNPQNMISLIEGSLNIQHQKNTIASIIPISEKLEGITLEGFEYPLQEGTLIRGDSKGISNRIVEENAKVCIEKGIGFFILAWE